MCAEGQARPPGQVISKSEAASGRGKEVAVQERRERLAGRAPVQALERAVVEHAVDPTHLLFGTVSNDRPLGR